MCWNFETSSLTFFVVLAVGVSLYNRGLYNDKLLGIFVISFGTMQLFESLMWLGQNENLKQLNYIGSYLAGIFLHLHPLLLLLAFYLDKKTYPNIEKNKVYKAFVVVSVLLALWAIWLNLKTSKSLFYTKPSANCGNLDWKFPLRLYYVIPFVLMIMILVLLAKPFEFKVLSLSYFVIALIISYFLVSCNSSLRNGLKSVINASDIGFGSYWCWFSALFSFILFFVNPLVQPKK